ncbi:hypothetical protein O3P69_008170 [Scylla paramamosain]|uniref:Uncharacterized protein n=1 Tax=Scylla paramamosain TaxID=85552 RepID=A0AAW0T0L8_SCYPA
MHEWQDEGVTCNLSLTGKGDLEEDMQEGDSATLPTICQGPHSQARAQAKGEEPEKHEDKNLYLAKIPQESLDLIKTVYKDLADPDLLQKCLKGRTQNPNEMLHSKVWRKVSKDKFCGLFRARFACQTTVLEHNFGYLASSLLLHLGFPTSHHTLYALMNKDKEMQRNAICKRKSKKRKKEADEEYEAGAH